MAAFAFAWAISAAAAAASPSVVSLNLCTDEIVMLVARPEQIASVSYLSHLREESALWRRARRFRANDGSMLAAAAFRPNLIVTMGSAGRDRERLAAAVGARLTVLPYAASLSDIMTSVRRIGEATGNQARAAAILSVMRAAIASAPGSAREVVWVDGAGRTLDAAGLGAAWLRIAGLRQSPVPGNRLTLERLLTRPPALLVQSRYRPGQMSSATTWMRHPAAKRVLQGRTLSTDGRRWTCAGPTLLSEILRLRRMVRP